MSFFEKMLAYIRLQTTCQVMRIVTLMRSLYTSRVIFSTNKLVILPLLENGSMVGEHGNFLEACFQRRCSLEQPADVGMSSLNSEKLSDQASGSVLLKSRMTKPETSG